MKVSDYIVEFLIKNEITDIFGYPGGMVTHLLESIDNYKGNGISAHVNYHEQASAMAACAWAEINGKPGVAYATSGPGATNLLTGIACAFFESIPGIYITGQVNTYEQKGELGVRQKGFQETDIVSIAKSITKGARMVCDEQDIPDALNWAWTLSMSGRKGPVLLDIPMNVFRGEIEHTPSKIVSFIDANITQALDFSTDILNKLSQAKRPVILAGHGISVSGVRDAFREFIDAVNIPVVTSMIAVDVLPSDHECAYGMIGTYGHRWSNYILNYSDCILSLGSRLDCRQTGVNHELFAPHAKILRVDIDADEMTNKIHSDEIHYCVSLETLMPMLIKQAKSYSFNTNCWIDSCNDLRNTLQKSDSDEIANDVIESISKLFPDKSIITTDVGQNQVWTAQSFKVKKNQRIIFSGGHGAMGYALPAAIGASVSSNKPVYCITGDGGLQMNIQELQTIMRENLNVTIILFNNQTLGMIHHFQEMYFEGNYSQTDNSSGYTVPDFVEIAKAYGLRGVRVDACEESRENIENMIVSIKGPALIEIVLPEKTHIVPKLGMNKPIHMQEPPLVEQLQNKVDFILQSLLGSKQ